MAELNEAYAALSDPLRRAETLLALPESPGDAVEVRVGAETLRLGPGQACLLPHGADYTVEASGPAQVYRVRAPGGERAEAEAAWDDAAI